MKQKEIDDSRRKMAEEIVDSQEFTTLEEAKEFAIKWSIVRAIRSGTMKQKEIDDSRRKMAEEIVDSQKKFLTTLEEAKEFAIKWIKTGAQHASNEAYYREERDKLEAQLGKRPVAEDLVQKLIDLLEIPSPDARALVERIENATHEANRAAERLEAAASKVKRAAEEISAASFRR